MESPNPPPSKTLPAIALLVLLLVIGFVGGGLVGGRLLAPGPGFDAIASALGGIGVGLVAALLLGALLVRRLDARGLRRAAAAALVVVVALGVVVALLKRAEPEPEPDSAPPRATPTEPAAGR